MLRNITLSAEEALIEQARERARRQSTTLNAAFRVWLERYVKEEQARERYDALMARLGDVQAGRSFSRDELNERQILP